MTVPELMCDFSNAYMIQNASIIATQFNLAEDERILLRRQAWWTNFFASWLVASFNELILLGRKICRYRIKTETSITYILQTVEDECK